MSTATKKSAGYSAGTIDKTMRFDALALAGSAAAVSAAVMLLLGVFAAIGIYEGAVEMMQQWHMFFEPTVLGTLAGMVEAAIISFVVVYPGAWLYNTLAR